jgi:hypothetical protein
MFPSHSHKVPLNSQWVSKMFPKTTIRNITTCFYKDYFNVTIGNALIYLSFRLIPMTLKPYNLNI